MKKLIDFEFVYCEIQLSFFKMIRDQYVKLED